MFAVPHLNCLATHSSYFQRNGEMATRYVRDSLIRLALESSSTDSLREMNLSKKFDFKLDLPVILNKSRNRRVTKQSVSISLRNNSGSQYSFWSLPGPARVASPSEWSHFAVMTPVMYSIVFDRLEHLALLVQVGHLDLNDLIVSGTNYIAPGVPKCPQLKEIDLELNNLELDSTVYSILSWIMPTVFHQSEFCQLSGSCWIWRSICTPQSVFPVGLPMCWTGGSSSTWKF